MIDTVVLDRPATLAAAETTLRGLAELDADTLRLATHWADLHDPACLPPAADRFEERRRRLDGDHPVRLGGDGTPEVLAGCLAELGAVLQTSSGGARHLVADALDLRHRLPLLWAAVMKGETRAWKARQVASATRALPASAMPEVDAGLAGLLRSLPWARFALVLEATVKRATPQLTRAQEEEAAQRRFVGVGRANDHGISTLIARGSTLDIQTFLAAVRRIADILALEGDPDPADVRRSKAVGILGQPARALALLALHRQDHDPHTDGREAGGRESDAADADGQPADADEADDADCRDVDPPDPQPQPQPQPDEPGRRALTFGPAEGVDHAALAALAAAGPRVQLYVHLTDAALTGADPCAVARVEGVGPVTAATVRAWLRRPDVSVTVRPVAVPGRAIPVDAYEIPASVREAVRLRSPASVFPWSGCTTRTMDLDHVAPFRPSPRGGPPGQTATDNLGPLARTEHRLKTGGRWQTRVLASGVQLWRTPHGWVHLVTNQGTYPLGRGRPADDVWRAGTSGAREQTRTLPYRPDGTRSLVEDYLRDLTGPASRRVSR